MFSPAGMNHAINRCELCTWLTEIPLGIKRFNPLKIIHEIKNRVTDEWEIFHPRNNFVDRPGSLPTASVFFWNAGVGVRRNNMTIITNTADRWARSNILERIHRALMTIAHIDGHNIGVFVMFDRHGKKTMVLNNRLKIQRKECLKYSKKIMIRRGVDFSSRLWFTMASSWAYQMGADQVTDNRTR